MLHHNDAATPTPCQTHDPELWFARSKRGQARAKELCRGCHRKLDCLEDALELEKLLGHPLKGIHGGLDARERANIQVRRIA